MMCDLLLNQQSMEKKSYLHGYVSRDCDYYLASTLSFPANLGKVSCSVVMSDKGAHTARN